MAQEYANTVSFFPPLAEGAIVGEGKALSDHEEVRVILVKAQTKGGKTIRRVYQEVGALWENEGRTEKQPLLSGSVAIPGFGARTNMAVWDRTGNSGKKFLSGQISEPMKKEADLPDRGAIEEGLNDEIPF
tara:strand:- start:317 stop:709 length:393 start_codon:yes stop_codon:yes gene_type:complete